MDERERDEFSPRMRFQSVPFSHAPCLSSFALCFPPAELNEKILIPSTVSVRWFGVVLSSVRTCERRACVPRDEDYFLIYLTTFSDKTVKGE